MESYFIFHSFSGGRGRNRSIFSRVEITTFRKGTFSREESCYPRVITPLGSTIRSGHMRAKLVPVPLSFVVSPWFMYLCIFSQPPLLDWSLHTRIYTYGPAIVRQAIYMYCSSMMCRERWPNKGRGRTDT